MLLGPPTRSGGRSSCCVSNTSAPSPHETYVFSDPTLRVEPSAFTMDVVIARQWRQLISFTGFLCMSWQYVLMHHIYDRYLNLSYGSIATDTTQLYQRTRADSLSIGSQSNRSVCQRTSRAYGRTRLRRTCTSLRRFVQPVYFYLLQK